VKDKVLIGISGAEFGVRCHMTAYDINSGKKVWRAYSMGPDSDIRFPKLFHQNLDTVMTKIPYIKALAEAVGTPMDAATILLRIPVAIAYAKNHLHLRYVLARTGHATSVSTAIVMPHAKAEAIVIKHYIDKARTLQVMYRKGLIKHLPVSMAYDTIKCDRR
jgi:hypothetical protein